MESKAKLLGHPVHQMLIVFPLGLLVTSVIFDLLPIWHGNPGWSNSAFYMIGAGLAGDSRRYPRKDHRFMAWAGQSGSGCVVRGKLVSALRRACQSNRRRHGLIVCRRRHFAGDRVAGRGTG
jgi:hypothetical protein